MAWSDNFSELVKITLPAESNKEWRFILEEHKTKGSMNMNVRLFQNAKVEGGYEGPTKNGFIQQINSIEDVEKMQKTFNEYFEKIKEML